MKIEVNIRKRHLFVATFILVAFGALFFVYAYDSSPPNPAVFGHTPSETGPGSNQAFGGSSTFGGGSSSRYMFSGKVGIGADPNPSSTELFLGDSDNSGDAGIGIQSLTGTGLSYIDFYSGSELKSNLVWNSESDALMVNSLFSSGDTLINPYSGSIGIGLDDPVGSPTSGGSGRHSVVDVYGAICLNGKCKGDGTGSGAWGRTVNEDLLIAQLNPNVGVAGYSEVVKIISPYNQGYTSGGSASFCALSQTQTSGTISGSLGAGCFVYVEGGVWKLKAYRNALSEGVLCRVVCMHNE